MLSPLFLPLTHMTAVSLRHTAADEPLCLLTSGSLKLQTDVVMVTPWSPSLDRWQSASALDEVNDTREN